MALLLQLQEGAEVGQVLVVQYVLQDVREAVDGKGALGVE